MKVLYLLLTLVPIFLCRDIPSFSPKFIGSFLRNVTYYDSSVSNHDVILDQANNKAYVAITSQTDTFDNDEGEYWLINSPVGAEPGTPQAKGFVIFKSLTAENEETYCSYSTYPDWSNGLMPPGKFPPQWLSPNGQIVLSSWFSFPNDMAYTGNIVWRGAVADLWESKTMCSLFGRAPAPCTRLITQMNTNVPLGVQTAHQKQGSFDSDWLALDLWKSFDSTNVPSIDPPEADWTKKCYNIENGFRVEPERGYVSTATGMDNFTLQLTAKPIDNLGPVQIQFQPSTLRPSTIDFLLDGGASAQKLQFDTTNWNVPITIYLKYLADGETYFNIVGTSGGYDIPFILTNNQNQPQTETRSAAFRAVTCANGIPGYGC